MPAATLATADTRLLTPAEVAGVFRVDVKTVTRWADTGRLYSIRTLGGHRRFRAEEIHGALHLGTTARLLPGPDGN
jgi:excisionase family DNA binding protein